MHLNNNINLNNSVAELINIFFRFRDIDTIYNYFDRELRGGNHLNSRRMYSRRVEILGPADWFWQTKLVA